MKKSDKKKDIGPFKYVNNINKDSEPVTDFYDSEYNAFLTNRALSYFSDTILQSNNMNTYHFLPKKTQYEYLFHSVRKRPRYSPWFKSLSDDDVKLIQIYFGCSPKEAKMYSEMLSEKDKEELRTMYGGTSKTITK
jgi:predicted glycosyltransferase involved in capsule biosynthesis